MRQVAEPYRLLSRWQVDVPVPEAWRLLADPRFTWPTWWPLLGVDEVAPRTDGAGQVAPGARATLRVRSPLGRPLRLGLTLAAVRPPGDADPVGSARFDVDGDLVGTARVTVRPVPRGSVVALRWDVTPSAARPDLAARRRLSAVAHAIVMRVGEAGLRRHLRALTRAGSR